MYAVWVTMFIVGLFGVSAREVNAFTGAGSGTAGSPYQITTCSQLQEMNDALTASYVLANDIDCSATVGWNGGYGFIPIGGPFPTVFSGTLDGQNHTVSNLYISTSTRDYVGLIGVFSGSGSVIKNIGLISPTIDAPGHDYVGPLAGAAFTGSIASSTYVMNGTVSARSRVGGLIGNVYSTLLNSYASSSVTASGTWAGSLVGVDSAVLIMNSFSLGSTTANTYAGGFGGGDGGPIQNSFTAAIANGPNFRGGFQGRSTNASSVSNNHYYSYTGGPSTCVGDLTGSFSCTARTDINYFKNSSNAPFTSWDFVNVWAMDGYNNGGFPYLRWQTFGAASTPSVQASNITFSNVSQESLTANWTNGDGNSRILFMKAASSGAAAPVDSSSYTGNAVFGSGTQIGSSGWYAVYKGAGTTTVAITGLTPGTAYIAHMIELNGSAGGEKYLTTSATNNPVSTTTPLYVAPATPASSVTVGTVSSKTATVSWTNGDGVGRIVFMKQGATSGSAAPVDGTTYAASATFGSGSQIGSTGWYAVYKGTGTSVSVSNLAYDSDYRIHVVEYNGSVGNEKYTTTSGTNNPKTRSAYAGTTIYSNYSTGNDTTGSGTSGAPYKTFYKAYTIAIDGDTINLTGTFTWSNADETGDTSSVGFTLSKHLTIQGQKAGDTIIQAATTENTADRRIFTYTSGYTIVVKNVTLRYGKATTGGCVLVSSTNIATFQFIDVTGCRSTSADGAGIYISSATTTIESSSIRNNTSVAASAGVYQTGSTSFTRITNTTITGNTNATSSSAYVGAGINVAGGTMMVTNSTITNNTAYRGAAAVSATGAILSVQNSIITSNSAVVAAVADTDIYKSAGIIGSSGYNIVGRTVVASFSSSTGDWVDRDGDGTFTLQTTNSTGSLSLSAAAVDSTYNTYVHALQVGSIGIDQATSTTHATSSVNVSVPSSDQRGTARVNAPDIGAYEYVPSDSTPPTVSLTLPTDGATIYGNAIGMSATASDETALSGVRFYVNNIAIGSEILTAPYSLVWNSLSATTSGTKTVVAVARDAANNYATSTARMVTLSNQPAPSSLAAATASTSATVTWTTPVEGSSRMFFGFTSALASSTAEQNTGTRVTSHSLDLSGLPPCAVFRYQTVSKNELSEVATSTASSFKTSGCSGGASILANNEDDITVASGGTLSQGVLALTIPAAFTSTSSQATFQAKKLDGSTFFGSISGPSGKTRTTTTVYNLSAYTDVSSTLSSFSQPLTVTFSYGADDVSGVDESTLKIYRYDSGSWNELSNCSVNTGARTVSCTTSNFSDFALFGDASAGSSGGSSGSSGSSSAAGNVLLWCSGPLAPGWQAGLPDGGCKKNQSGSLQASVTLSAALSTNVNTGTSGAAPAVAAITSNSEATVTYGPGVFNRTLRAGSSGDDVRRLQRYLNEQGYVLAPRGIGSPGNETDYFGPMTYNALIKFQEAHAKDILAPAGLTKGSGIFGPATMKYVNGVR